MFIWQTDCFTHNISKVHYASNRMYEGVLIVHSPNLMLFVKCDSPIPYKWPDSAPIWAAPNKFPDLTSSLPRKDWSPLLPLEIDEVAQPKMVSTC